MRRIPLSSIRSVRSATGRHLFGCTYSTSSGNQSSSTTLSKEDFTNFLTSLQSSSRDNAQDTGSIRQDASSKSTSSVTVLRSIYDLTEKGTVPSLELQKQRLRQLLETRPIEYLLAFPFMEDSMDLRQRLFHLRELQLNDAVGGRFQPRPANYPPNPYLYSADILDYYPRDFMLRYSRLAQYQVFRAWLLQRIEQRRSVDRWLRSISPRLFDLETADCEKIYIQELMRYNTEEYGGPHSKITNHILSTLPKLLKVYKNHGLNEQGELTLTLALNNAQ